MEEETINKEISDALHMLLHCALKDKEFETQKEQFHIIYDYIKELEEENNQLKLKIRDLYKSRGEHIKAKTIMTTKLRDYIPTSLIQKIDNEGKVPLTIVGGRRNGKTLEYGIKLGRKQVLQEILEEGRK